MVDPEHPMLVDVASHRLAPALEIGAGGVEISKGRLALDKLQMHQPAGRVVDEHQQGALRPAVFEPPMLAAVDLYHSPTQSRRRRGWWTHWRCCGRSSHNPTAIIHWRRVSLENDLRRHPSFW